jgi:uncharacterized membrane protein
MTALRRYAPFYSALACGMAMLALAWWFWPTLAVQASANVFFVIYLALEFMKFHRLTPEFLRKHAASTDEPAWIIALVTFGAVLVAVGSLFVLINKGGQPDPLELLLSLTSVALGWFSIHTMTALHYAHLYWRPGDRRREMSSESDEQDRPDSASDEDEHGGLDFPGGSEPSGYDFLYYSLVVGMTAQTADVDVTKTSMRKLTLIHAVVSFFFNTVLVAAAVNVAVSLAAD